MALVFACIAPHSGHLLLGKNEPSPIPKTRIAMAIMAERLAAANPDVLAIITPHGIVSSGAYTLYVGPAAVRKVDDTPIDVITDLDLAAAWAYRAVEQDIRVVPFTADDDQKLPLDWGVTIPLALLDTIAHPKPAVVACPDRAQSRNQLIAWGDSLVTAASEIGKRVALIVSADQGHGHAADGPYGFAPESEEYDTAMVAAIVDDNLPQLLTWDDRWIDTAMPDSYWQTLALIGIQSRLPFKANFLSYEVDHYFGLICATFEP